MIQRESRTTPAAPQGEEELLPQTLVPPPREAAFTPERKEEERIKEIVIASAAKILKRPEGDFDCFPPRVPTFSQYKKRHSFELQDTVALKGLRLGEASIITVFMAKAPGHGDLRVPIMMPHQRDDQAGEKIKNDVDAYYRRTHGASPEELARSRTVKALNKMKRAIRDHKRALTFSGIGVAVTAAGILVAPSAHHAYRHWQEQRQIQREAQYARLISEAENIRRIIDQNPPNPGDVFRGITEDHWEAISSTLKNKNPESRRRGVDLYGFLTVGYHIYAPQGETYTRECKAHEDTLVNVIKSDGEREVRGLAAEWIHSLGQVEKK